MKYLNVSIAVAGEGKTIPSIILCLLQAGHRVKSIGGTKKGKALHELAGFSSVSLDNYQDCQGLPEKENLLDCSLIIIFTPENPDIKKTWISRIARIAPEHALILVNSESIPLEELQSGLPDPSRLLGLNWVYPAHLTLFAELLSTPENREEEMEALMVLMAKNWGKDPYHLKSGKSIRSKLLAALAREAFFLVDQGYVEVADIDRACRNDPGYYLPFAGNCRYMDLMGTFIYGVVMKDLNPELSNAMEIPAYFN
ncbi:MAG: 3-hydroxyacyl-CoA dehydrogenase NAD-binding domain-containing protein, partial [Cyclobacteriaceae bacterium]